MPTPPTSSASSPMSPHSRRSFLRLAGLAAIAAPILSEHDLARAAILQNAGTLTRPGQAPGGNAHARAARIRGPIPPGAVLINANENPLGPCVAALDAISASARTGGRYDLNNYVDTLAATFAKQNSVPQDHVAVYAGSSEPLTYSIMAFTSPSAPYVTADPSYDVPHSAAQAVGAPIVTLPLTASYAHDVKSMVAASPNAGLLYICNPNNPTGTLTPREDILWALDHKPRGSVLLVDEAYIHLSDSPSVLDQVAAGRDLIVLRTFSKVYGMAGIRCGFAVARPDLLAKLNHFGMNSMPVTAAAAATASLNDATLVPARKKIIADTREHTFTWLSSKGYKYVPSQSNCFMIDTGRPAQRVIDAMRAENVFIGRVWPVWPNYVRISVGTPEEMSKFQAAFAKVMSA